jgi:hypothetical protein
MSSLWTPGGERPVGRGPENPPARPAPPSGPDDLADDEELEARAQELAEQLARTPAAVVVANHAMGLFELGALHLSQQPPNLDQASLAIDAMAALVEGLQGRLGESEPTLSEALAQIRLAFVQLKAANAAGEA